LVAGPGAGGKVDAAKAKGVVIWTEAEFSAAMSGGGAAAPKAVVPKAKAAATPKAAPVPKAATKGQGKAAAEPPASPVASSSAGGALKSPGGGKRPDR
jgi:hypothetical protein